MSGIVPGTSFLARDLVRGGKQAAPLRQALDSHDQTPSTSPCRPWTGKRPAQPPPPGRAEQAGALAQRLKNGTATMAPEPLRSYDLGWMWDELRLAEFRR